MAFHEYEQESISFLPNVSWIELYIAENGSSCENCVYDVLAIKPTPKGVLLFTESFMCFVWESSKVGHELNKLFHKLEIGSRTPSVMIKISTRVKAKFVVGQDDECESVVTNKSESVLFLSPDLTQPPSFTQQGEGESNGYTGDLEQPAEKKRQKRSI